MNPKLAEITLKSIKKDLPTVNVGDTVKVTVKIKEGNKERSQNYEGTIIKLKGSGVNKTFTVRRVFQGVGVERVFLFHSPKIEKIKILKSGETRRAKLYYLRKKTGKATRLQEKMTGTKEKEEEGLTKEEIPQEGKLVEVK